MSRDGIWQRIAADGALLDPGQMFIGQSGEKLRFRISPRVGQTGVWHGIQSGWTQFSSSYQNSLRAGNGQDVATWAEVSCYPEQGDDRKHPSLGVDSVHPTVAYIAARYAPGVVINVWDGAQMLFPTGDLPIIESSATNHGNGCDRFGPQWTPAVGGGAFLCWTTNDSRIKMAYVSPAGIRAETHDITDGRACTMATDDLGGIHLIYVRQGVRYRHLTTDARPFLED